MTEQLHFHVSLSCIGEGNGNPLQCSCLENPRASGAWWAAVYGVAQSWTRLRRLAAAAAATSTDGKTHLLHTEAASESLSPRCSVGTAVGAAHVQKISLWYQVCQLKQTLKSPATYSVAPNYVLTESWILSLNFTSIYNTPLY